MNALLTKLTGLLSCLLLAGLCAQAQTYEPANLTVHAQAMYDGNQVIVRWVPNDFETWQWGLNNGYRLERMTLKSNGAFLTPGDMANSKIVLDSVLLPLSEMDWEAMADTNDMAGTAAGVIYGDSMEVISYDEAGFTDVIQVNQERENRFSFALFSADNSFEVAEAMGIGFADTTVATNKEYLYTVTINNVPASTEARKGSVNVETVSGGSLPVPQNIVAIPGDHSALIAWDSDNLGEHYSSYCVEVSSDGGNTYQPAHDLPLIFGEQRDAVSTNAAFQDSLPANGVTYIYRVKGKTPFGQMGPWSDTVHVVGLPPTLGVQPAATTIEEVNEGKTDYRMGVSC